VTTAGRYHRRAQLALSSYFADATYGLPARCTAINTAENDDYDLPTAWAEHEGGRHIQYPCWEHQWRGTRIEGLPTQYGDDEWNCRMRMGFWLPLAGTSDDPASRRIFMGRLGQAVLECLTVREVGRTLNRATQISMVHSIDVQPAFRPGFKDGKQTIRAYGVSADMVVVVTEEDTFTS